MSVVAIISAQVGANVRVLSVLNGRRARNKGRPEHEFPCWRPSILILRSTTSSSSCHAFGSYAGGSAQHGFDWPGCYYWCLLGGLWPGLWGSHGALAVGPARKVEPKICKVDARPSGTGRRNQLNQVMTADTSTSLASWPQETVKGFISKSAQC